MKREVRFLPAPLKTLDDPATWPAVARDHMGKALRTGVDRLHASSVESMLNRGLLQPGPSGVLVLHPAAVKAYRRWAGLPSSQ